MAKTPKLLIDEVRGDNYVRAWKERRNIVVQVWKGKNYPEGEPNGDWEMPGVLGLTTAVEQAILQTH